MFFHISRAWLLWAPMAAAGVHIGEEFLWPGGFRGWYQNYRGQAVSSITPRFLISINVGLIVACMSAALAANTRWGAVYWLEMLAILGSNGVWHVCAAVKSRSYSPGMVTGVFLYVPLALLGYIGFLRSGSVSLVGAGIALLLGGSYPFWSAMYHARSRSAA